MNIPETFFSVNEEMRLFGYSCLLGAALGLFYDVFRTLRMLFRHNTVLIAIEDIVFFAAYAIAITAFASAAARGEMRFYYVIGSVSGFILYLLTLGQLISAVIKKLIAALRVVFHVILSPLRRFYVLLRKKAVCKFVGTSKVFVQKLKKAFLLLLKRPPLLYNKKENKMRKNGDNFVKKTKKDGTQSLQRSARKTRSSHSSNRLHSNNRINKQRLL